MKLTVLGSGAFIPTVKRNNSGFVVEAGGKLILMDLGPGTIRQLVKAGYDFRKIDIVIISHLHVDHINDLSSLMFLYNSEKGFSGKKELTVIGGKGIKKFINDISNSYSDVKPKSGKLELQIIEEKNTDFGNFTIETMPGNHTESSIMIKIKQGEQELVYTGDTAYIETIKQFTQKPELLITECTLAEGKEEKGHLTPSEAAKMANLVLAKRLLLVHLAPEVKPAEIVWEATKSYKRRLIIAEDFLKVQF